MKRLLTFLLFVFIGLQWIFSMNVKSLEITWENETMLTYRGNVIFYLYDPSPVDTTIVLNWGDNTSSPLSVSSIEDIPGPLKKVTYSGIHTYPGPFTYIMFVSYKVRNVNVINVPQSLTTDIYVEAGLMINSFIPIASRHKSPVFYESPSTNVCSGVNTDLNFSAFDEDGDSLVYSLVACRGENGEAIPGYTFPTASSSFTINSVTGQISWNCPFDRGFFNFAVKVKKYWNGIIVGSVMRDVSINVIDCSNETPELNIFNDTCMLPGNVFNHVVTATYQGADTIILTASGEPLLLNNPATFPQPVYNCYNVSSIFSWPISCELVRPNPYTISFNADLKNSLNYCDNTYRFESSYSPFYTNAIPIIGTPCGPGWDNSNYLWFGSDTAAPRFIVTPEFDVSDGNYMIVFDMRLSEHTGIPCTCEGPDRPDEGIYLQYSLNGINGIWDTIAYWDPSISPGGGGHVENLIHWNNYSIVVPEGAISSATRFRWIQFESTSRYYDHWGLDNISIHKISDKIPVQKKVNITVIAPAPENLIASPINNNAYLKWNKEICSEAIGYYIYRKADSSGYVPSGCETGVPTYTGYVFIDTLIGINDTTYTDNNNGMGLPHGNEYCYMVTAWFANGAESQASNEACVSMPDDEPVITNVSVTSTNTSSGSMFIAWSKPNNIDTLTYTEDFRYDIYSAENFTGNTYLLLSSNAGLNDTIFNNSTINTVDKSWHYRIDLMYAADGFNYTLFSSSFPASSVFLTITALNKSLLLNWEYMVPWNNSYTVVYRYNTISSSFDSIGLSFNNQFLDTGLVNGTEYCYKIKTVGSYSLNGFVNPICNFSQKVCNSPQDVQAPCPVTLMIKVDCNQAINNLYWTNPKTTCGDNDVIGYKIYYSQIANGKLTFLDVVNNPEDTFYTHIPGTSVAGCYAVTAIDSAGNNSELSNVVCVDIDECNNQFELPNIFTPNGDGYNDFFTSSHYTFVEKVNMTIFNRWGIKVFSTENPHIMWDGKNQNNGIKCSDGIYFYICDVYERRLSGIKKRTLTGTISLYGCNQ